MSTGGKVALGVTGAVVAFGILGAIAGPGDDTKTASGTTERAESAKEESSSGSSSGSTIAAAGTPVRDGKFEFRVVDVGTAKTVGDPTGNPYMQETAQGTYVVVTLSVTNIGNEPQSFFATNQKLIDSQGREFSPSSEADLYMNEDAILTDINPGNSIEVKVAFDVQPGITAKALELHDSAFSGGALVALPGKVG